MTETLARASHEAVQTIPQSFILTGPEGSGKTVQGKLLAEKLGAPYIAVGDLLRDRAKNDPGEIGEACREIFSSHTYLNPSLVRRIVADRLSEEDTANGFVLDGANRSVEETEHLPETLELADRSDHQITIISLRLAGWQSMRRLMGRGREDDSIEGALSRLSRYYDRLGERASIMRRNWRRFIQIDARGSNEDKIEQETDKKKKRKLIRTSELEVHERIVKGLGINE